MQTQPLSAAQRRIWLAEQLQPGTPAYVLAVAGVIDGVVDIAGLRRALRAAARRYPALRNRCVDQHGEPVWEDAGDPDIDLPVLDLRYLMDAQRREALDQVLAEHAQRPFDLAREVALRSRFVLLPDRAVLVLAAHRIAVDEPSIGALIRELFAGTGVTPAAGPVTAGGEPNPAGPQPSRECLQYWRRALAGLAPAPLPTDRPRSPIPPSGGATAAITLPSAARALGTDGLLAGLQALLVRLGAGPDVAVTVTDDAELVIRTDLSDDPDFDTLVARTRAARRAAHEHAQLSFAQLATEIGRGGTDPRHDPFTGIALVVRDRPLLPAQLTPLLMPRLGVRYELRFVLEPDTDGGMRGWLEYATDLFDAVTAERIAARYARLLTAASREPRAALSALPLLMLAEHRLFVVEWNSTEVAFPDDTCLHHRIAEQARLAPDAPAVICGDRVLTYGDLQTRANRLAHVLRAHGAGPEQLVAVCAERSTDTVVALVAILQAGAAYLPLDPAYPAQRLAFMLTDSRAAVVVTDTASRSRLPESEASLVLLDDRDEWDGGSDRDELSRGGEGAPVGPPEVRVDPGNLCYVIYTSGSTGQPKGAANVHRGVLNTMTALASRLQMDSATRLLQTSSLSFDMSSFDILTTLLTGGCLVVPEAAEAADPGQLLDLVHRHAVTVWSSTPALFKAALDEVLTSGGTLPEQLRTVILGGDQFPLTIPEALAQLLPNCRIFNTAGMTEVSFTTTAYRVPRTASRRSSIPWGRPLPNQRMYVLDRYGKPVPPGVPGELYIGGVGVGRGYWARPALTAERFVPDPFAPRPGARMYRTGDQVRHLSDGNLEFLGRLDHQVKVRGIRIELGEVEAALGQHPLVSGAVATVRTDDVLVGQRLVAYLTFGDPDQTAAVEELRAFLRARLPEHLVPSTYVALSQIPLLPSGKIDRSALDAMELPAIRPPLATPYIPPRDELERQIVEEWSLVLGVDRVGVEDDFAALGGHSMLATPTMAALAEVLGVELSARDLYEAPTPVRLAARVRQLAPGRFPD